MIRKSILTAIVLLCAALGLRAEISYDNTKAKADRFFDNKEWASAAAVYGLMLHERPDVAATYGRAIVANEMLSDTIKARNLLTQAMEYGVPLDSVLGNVQRCAFSIGQSKMYERFLIDASRQHGWLERPLDAYLLRYYTFRRNGQKMVEMANKLLTGSPSNVSFMAIAAEGNMISGNAAKAADIWNQIVERDPDNYTAILNLANYYDITGDATAALFFFKRAKALHDTPYVDERIAALTGPRP